MQSFYFIGHRGAAGEKFENSMKELIHGVNPDVPLENIIVDCDIPKKNIVFQTGGLETFDAYKLESYIKIKN